MSHVLQLMASTGRSLSQLAAAIPSYTMIKRKFTCPRERAAGAVAAVEKKFAADAAGGAADAAESSAEAADGATEGAADAAKGAGQAGAGSVHIDKSDGIRIDTPEGWVHLRASNTEPIIRLIGEAPDEATCERLIAKVAAAAGL
jgi:phosphomannomutase